MNYDSRKPLQDSLVSPEHESEATAAAVGTETGQLNIGKKNQ